MATASCHTWTYKPRSNDPPMVKEMTQERLNELAESVSLMDSYNCHFAGCLTFRNGIASKADNAEEKLILDFKKNNILFPKNYTFSNHYLVSSIDASDVRYAAFFATNDLDLSFDSEMFPVVVVSMWEMQNKDIHNIYLVLDKSEAMLLMNAVSRLISNQSPSRVEFFHPLLTGRVLVSTCSLDQHSKNLNCCSPESVMSFVLDLESLGFYEKSFGNKPVIDFRFYKEQGPRSLDMISISMIHGHIEMQQGSSIYFIKKLSEKSSDTEVFQKLIQMFREKVIESRAQDYYKAPERYEHGPLTPLMYHSNREMLHREADWQSYKESDVKGHESSSSLQSTRWNEAEWQRPRRSDLNPTWLNHLNSGQLNDCDETMQMMWLTLEPDLRKCLDSGTVPYTDSKSGGLDPDSVDHLQRSLDDIRDHLFNENIELALSRLHSCLQIFGNTLLEKVAKLDEVELLKRIYFLAD